MICTLPPGCPGRRVHIKMALFFLLTTAFFSNAVFLFKLFLVMNVLLVAVFNLLMMRRLNFFSMMFVMMVSVYFMMNWWFLVMMWGGCKSRNRGQHHNTGNNSCNSFLCHNIAPFFYVFIIRQSFKQFLNRKLEVA